MKNNIYLITLIFISLLTLFSNYKVYNANVNQIKLVEILRNAKTAEIDSVYLKRISTNYPTLSSTAFPLKSLIGTYWAQNDSLLKGLELIREGNKDNPYLGFSDAMLASFYDAIGIIDSFTHYAREATRKLPNAPQHYVLNSRVYVLENKIDSLKILFDRIKNNIEDPQIFRIYLAATLNNRDKIDSLELINDALYAKKRFPLNPQITLLSDYIIYGESKVKEYVELKQTAIDSFEKNPAYSISVMKKIISNQEANYSNYETLIEMYFLNKNFTEVTDLYQDAFNKGISNFRAVIVEFVSISYVNSNRIIEGCFLARDLVNYNYKISPSLAKTCNIEE